MMGGYVQGKDQILDEAILMWPKILDFISQKEGEKINYDECISMLLRLYDEKNNNPRLQVKSKEEYAEIMQNLNLANPKMMDIAVPANVKGLTLDQI
mgnify:CR=1 FL=1